MTNAIVTLVADRAMEGAANADEAQVRGAALGPLHGLPVAHKDLVDTAGVRIRAGDGSRRPAAGALISQRDSK